MYYNADMKSYIFLKRFNSIPLEAAHIYEHLFIESFRKYAVHTLGIDDAVIGYIGGETFENVLFIEAWFYESSVSDLFEAYILKNSYDNKLIDTAIKQCEAEGRFSLAVLDQKAFTSTFETLNSLPWIDGTTLPVTSYEKSESAESDSLFQIHKNAKHFKSITISPYLVDASVEDVALYRRLSVIVHDIVDSVIRAHGWYEPDSYPIKQAGTFTHTVTGVTLPVGDMSNHAIEDEIESRLHDFDIKKNFSLIKAHFNYFAAQPTWIGDMRNDLHRIDVMVGNEVVNELATEVNIARLLSRIQVRVENVPYSFAKNITY